MVEVQEIIERADISEFVRILRRCLSRLENASDVADYHAALNAEVQFTPPKSGWQYHEPTGWNTLDVHIRWKD